MQSEDRTLSLFYIIVGRFCLSFACVHFLPYAASRDRTWCAATSCSTTPFSQNLASGPSGGPRNEPGSKTPPPFSTERIFLPHKKLRAYPLYRSVGGEVRQIGTCSRGSRRALSPSSIPFPSIPLVPPLPLLTSPNTGRTTPSSSVVPTPRTEFSSQPCLYHLPARTRP